MAIDVIHERVRCLTGWLLEQPDRNETLHRRAAGALVRTDLHREDAAARSPSTSSTRTGKPSTTASSKRSANKVNISLRTGCFCNPGAGEIALGISRVELDVCFSQPTHEERLSLDDFRLCIDGKSSGAVRISVGMVTNFDDVQKFLEFAQGLVG